MLFCLFTACAIVPRYAAAQQWEPNYDESKVPEYTLPDPLTFADGRRTAAADEWFALRRPEILETFQKELYGIIPSADIARLHYAERKTEENGLGGKAVRKEGILYFNWPEETPKLDLLIYLPKTGKVPFPAFLGLNFCGNHTVTNEPGITVTDNPYGARLNKKEDQEKLRGLAASRWQAERVVERGYALVTAYYEDIAPDFPDGAVFGVSPLFVRFMKEKSIPNEFAPAAISTWAWGLSRILDTLETIPEIDARRVAVLGHSRLGKTALWAGANDPRFALVISNNSGCGGAALYRREFGETFDFMNNAIAYWFCGNSRKYAGNVSALPFDQHELIALIAPRPVYIASAQEDQWADPKGEFLSALGANPVYRFLGSDGLDGVTEWPKVNHPVGGTIHYHLQSGEHDVTPYDWEQYLDFADRYMK